MEYLAFFLHGLRQLVWGPPLLLLLAFTGLWFTFHLRGIQFRRFPLALRCLFVRSEGESGEMSHFQALMTAMAGAIGTGSIAGVATAITIGGYGSLFWMWLIALLGMATSYAECLLSVKYRTRTASGHVQGGPMYVIERGLGWKKMAICFAIFAALAGFGIGSTVQANSVADTLHTVYGVETWATGLALTLVTLLVLSGGARWVGNLAGVMVPAMALLYVLFGLGIVFQYASRLPEALQVILTSAFTGKAAIGGATGGSMLLAIQMGVSRGVFSNESGLGSTAIAAAATHSPSPVRQGLIAILGTFLATMVICTLTGLLIFVTNVIGDVDSSGRLITGSALVVKAFEAHYSWGGHIVTMGIVCFAYSTTMAWAYYGQKCMAYLIGHRGVHFYRWLYSLLLIPGAVMNIHLVWAFADSMNGLMAFPNLVGILMLTPVVIAETKRFFNEDRMELETNEIGGQFG